MVNHLLSTIFVPNTFSQLLEAGVVAPYLKFYLCVARINCPTTQDRGPFWFSYILNEILQYIEIWNEFKVLNHCPHF